MTDAPGSPRGHHRPQPGGKARYLALLVPAFGLIELGAHFFFARRAPKAEEWTAVRPAVASWYKSGSAVVIAPYWAEPMARPAQVDTQTSGPATDERRRTSVDRAEAEKGAPAPDPPATTETGGGWIRGRSGC